MCFLVLDMVNSSFLVYTSTSVHRCTSTSGPPEAVRIVQKHMNKETTKKTTKNNYRKKNTLRSGCSDTIFVTPSFSFLRKVCKSIHLRSSLKDIQQKMLLEHVCEWKNTFYYKKSARLEKHCINAINIIQDNLTVSIEHKLKFC